MHFKRHRAKNQRAGCLLCKPHKANGTAHGRAQVLRATADAIEELVPDMDLEELEDWDERTIARWERDDEAKRLRSLGDWWRRPVVIRQRPFASIGGA